MVASLDEQPFTFTHAVGCDEVGGLLTGSTHFGDMPGDDAEYLASIVADFLSDDFHEASRWPLRILMSCGVFLSIVLLFRLRFYISERPCLMQNRKW